MGDAKRKLFGWVVGYQKDDGADTRINVAGGIGRITFQSAVMATSVKVHSCDEPVPIG